MFEFDDLDEPDASSSSAPAPEQADQAIFQIQGAAFPMKLPRTNMTPADVMEVWEREWGILYATRLRFMAPEGSSVKWLNSHGHSVPPAPAIVRLDGAASVLQALAPMLEKRWKGEEQQHSSSLHTSKSGASASQGAPRGYPTRPGSSLPSHSQSTSGPRKAPVLAKAATSAPAPKASLGPVERAQLRHYVNALNRRSGKFGQGHSHGRLFGQPNSEEEQLRMEREEYLVMQAERRKQEDRQAREEAERQRRSHLAAASQAASASAAFTSNGSDPSGARRAAYEEHRDMWRGQ